MTCRRLATLLALAAALVSSRSAFAGPGCSPGAIPDHGYTGAVSSMVCCDFTYHEAFPGTVEDVFAELALTHTWLGDLVIKLQSPSATVSTLQSRAGLTESIDNGTGCCGSSANWGGAPISYDEHNGGPSAELMGTGLTSNQNVCTDNGVCLHTPAPGIGPGNGLDVDFDGETYVGTWKLCVGDAAGGDTGTYSSGGILIKFNRRIPCTCTGKFRGGDRVKYSPQFAPVGPQEQDVNFVGAIAGGSVPPTPGSGGEAECGLNYFGTEYILVKWDGYSGGHAGEDLCQCPTGGLPAGSTAGYYVKCSELNFDLPWSDDFESGDSSHWTSTTP